MRVKAIHRQGLERRADGGARRCARALLPALLLLAALGSSCATWKPVHRDEGWTLYSEGGEPVDVERYHAVLAPALAAVEMRMGPFERSVRVHAWNPETMTATQAVGSAEGQERGQLQDVPGIGPARVRAFHVRSQGWPFAPSGIFLGAPLMGTAVHELVHARLAELERDVPLWFEEGLASLLGDGVEFDGRWVFDGLACWPLRELQLQQLSDEELGKLIGLTPRDEYGSRENLLVHFIGWAIVFDLARETPGEGWQQWLARFEAGARSEGATQHARTRLQRTLAPETIDQWLERLGDSDPGVRLAAAKGIWKLRSPRALQALLAALQREEHPEVRFGIALNALLANAETRSERRSRRLLPSVFPVLRQAELSDPAEREAAVDLYTSMQFSSARRRNARESFEALARFWEE